MAGAVPSIVVPIASNIADRTRHHTALRLLPFLFALYIANYLDRTSVAYAAIGMTRELGFSDRVFGLGAGVFFVSYVALQIPGALLVERWSARRVICLTMIVWGSITALTAFVHTPFELYAARFLLGAAEAGFFPGVIVYLSHWFIYKDRGKATSNFMSAIPLSFVIASPIAGLILGHSWLSLAIPILQALRSRTIVLLASVCFLNYFAYYSFLFWLPTMLKRQSGLSDLNVGMLGALPYVALFFALLFNGWHSDEQRERRWHCSVPSLIAATGLLGLVFQPHSTPLALMLISLATLGNAYLPAMWAMPTEYLTKSAAAAAVGMINAVGSVAGFAGPYLFGYLNTKFGSFSYGLAVLTFTSLSAGLLVLRIPKRKQVPAN